MTGLFLGLYAVYAIMVSIAGNTQKLFDQLGPDLRGYMPWLLAIIFLAILNEFDATRDFIKPILVLLVLNFFLRNANTVKAQLTTIYQGQ